MNPSIKVDHSEYCPPAYTEPPIRFIPSDIVIKSLAKYNQNNFIQWLKILFSDELVDKVIDLYKIGTAKKWKGSTVFWQIDQDMKVRQGKMIQYNVNSGKRNKKLGCFFVGKQILKSLEITEPHLKQTFFGAHLTRKFPHKIIGIVESEKSAILMTLYALLKRAPDYVYLATGGSSGCRWYENSVNEFLRLRDIVIIPDLGQYDSWLEKSEFLNARSVTVTNVLESVSNDDEKAQGLDIADFYVEEHNDFTHDKREYSDIKSVNQIKYDALLDQNPMLAEFVEKFDLSFE